MANQKHAWFQNIHFGQNSLMLLIIFGHNNSFVSFVESRESCSNQREQVDTAKANAAKWKPRTCWDHPCIMSMKMQTTLDLSNFHTY